MSLNKAVVVVTGGSQGLGKSIVETMVLQGATVVIADIQADKARDLAESLTKKGNTVEAVALNVADPQSVDKVLSQINRTYGHLDVVINNAGIDVTKSIDEISVDEWSRVIDVNLKGPFMMMKKAFEIMYEQGFGQVINIASTAAKRAWPNASAYHASKWGLVGLSHGAFTEARTHGVRVTVVIAGGMRTPFILDRFPDVDPQVLQDPQTVAQVILHVLELPQESIIPEVMVIPLKETSWP